MLNARLNVPLPVNEPVRNYAPKSPERASLKATLEELGSTQLEIPAVINGEHIFTGRQGKCVAPHRHTHILARFHKCGEKEVAMAIDAAEQAWPAWSAMAWKDRAAIFLKAADLLAGPWRDRVAAKLSDVEATAQAEHPLALRSRRNLKCNNN